MFSVDLLEELLEEIEPVTHLLVEQGKEEVEFFDLVLQIGGHYTYLISADLIPRSLLRGSSFNVSKYQLVDYEIVAFAHYINRS